MSLYERPATYNIVRDYNISQGVSHPSDLSPQIVRNINLRYVTVENSSPFAPISIAITDSERTRQIPPINFSLGPGAVKHIGINQPGEPMQFIHMLSYETGKYLGDPYPFRTDANQFVLRHGINKWFVDAFYRAGYRAAF